MEITGARYSGILFHLTSIRTKYGIGDMGRKAYEFVDKLARTGATLWQVLPLGPTGYGNSPYAARSTFAGNELLIDLEDLVDEGYLNRDDIAFPPDWPSSRVDFDRVRAYKLPLLKKAAGDFLRSRRHRSDYSAFKQANASWLDGYAVFMTLYDEKYQDARWMLWEDRYSPQTLKKYSKQAETYRVLQYFFLKQWLKLKSYANGRGIRIIGDIPIFVGADSADTWSNIQLFKTDAKGGYSAISGVPPDNFSATGQRWGNPVYDWKKHEETGFSWWIERIRKQLELCDIIRIDHFRGFDAYWEVKASCPTAVDGKWVKAPGKAFFKALRNEFGELPIIAEDLGFMTDSVNNLRRENHLPGMKIFQFGFTRLPDGSFNSWDTFLPHNWDEDFVAYPGTHDNETLRGWYENQDDGMKDIVRRYLSSDDKEIVWAFLNALMLSHARYAIVQLQDILGLGNEARMNTPSTCNDLNWSWSVSMDDFTDWHIARFRHLVEISGRDGMTFQERLARIGEKRSSRTSGQES